MRYLLIFCLFISPPVSGYQSVGTDSTIDMMTWNIKTFPVAGATTLNEVKKIIQDLEVDLIAVQEIKNANDFNRLLALIPGWRGILSPHAYADGSYDKVGIIYNENKIAVAGHRLILTEDGYNLPRPPMEFTLTAHENQISFDFKLIVLHLKAFSDPVCEERRRQAMIQLKNYLDEQLMLSPEKDFIMLGDFNDELEDPPSSNVFLPLSQETRYYTFLTTPLAGLKGSYIFWSTPSLIDHILISGDARTEYGFAGKTDVLYLDQENSQYSRIVSDHRPVLAQFSFVTEPSKVNIYPIAKLHERFNTLNGQTVSVRGIVTLGAGILNPTHTLAYIQDSSLAGISIFKNNEILTDFQRNTRVEITGKLSDYFGLHEIQYQSHRVLATGQELPEPLFVSTGSVSATPNQGRLVQIRGKIGTISGTADQLWEIDDGTGCADVFFDQDARFDLAQFSVGDWIQIIGVKSVYQGQGRIIPGYQEDLDTTSTAFVPAGLPSELNEPPIIKNYPNPFNTTTTISIHLPAPAATLKLTIFNYLGESIETRLFRHLPAGYLEFVWSADQWPSGIYLVQITAGNHTGFRKLLLVR